MSYRRLLWHPESDCLMEVTDEKEYEQLMRFGDGHCEDVTGIPEYEEMNVQLKEQAKCTESTL